MQAWTSSPRRLRVLQTPLAVLVLLTGQRWLSAQQNSGSAAQQELARQYIAAVQSGDAARIKALFHPKVLACINEANREVFDQLLSSEISSPPPWTGYKVTIYALGGGMPALGFPPELFVYPVQPTYQIQIDWNQTGSGSTMAIRPIAQQGDRWYLDYQCPTPAGVRWVHEMKAKMGQQPGQARSQEKHVRELMTELRDPLRGEMKALLNQGRKIDAIKKYRAATGADQTTAVALANALEKAEH